MGKFLQHNLTPKLLSLVVALILWVFVMNEQNPPIEANFQVALAQRNLAENLILTDAPEAIRIKVRAPRNLIGSTSGKDFSAFLELKGMVPGQHTLPVAFAIPSGYELVEVSPDKLQVRIDSLRSRDFPVEVRLTGPIVGEMILGRAIVEPSAISISGPRSLVDAVDRVVALAEVREKAAGFSVEAKIIILGADGKELRGLTIEPAKVKVTGQLQPGSITRAVEVKTVVSGDLPEGTLLRRVFVEPAKVEVSGPKELVDKVEALYTEPISLTGVTKDVTREVPLQVRDGVTVNRPTVMVRITVGQAK
jgi:YbbR domain-containing protein